MRSRSALLEMSTAQRAGKRGHIVGRNQNAGIAAAPFRASRRRSCRSPAGRAPAPRHRPCRSPRNARRARTHRTRRRACRCGPSDTAPSTCTRSPSLCRAMSAFDARRDRRIARAVAGDGQPPGQIGERAQARRSARRSPCAAPARRPKAVGRRHRGLRALRAPRSVPGPRNGDASRPPRRNPATSSRAVGALVTITVLAAASAVRSLTRIASASAADKPVSSASG